MTDFGYYSNAIRNQKYFKLIANGNGEALPC